MARSIVQIIPSGGWRARFDSLKRKEASPQAKAAGNAGFHTEPLVCWALVVDLPPQEVVGMIQKSAALNEVVFADEEPGFLGYESN
jgi:hypothetical protein